MNTLRKPGAQPENGNALNERRGLPRQLAAHISIPGKQRAAMESRLAKELGHHPSPDEAKAKFKALALYAIDAYISS